ncbi:hypothetical protein BSKO_08440 [Bryopsis sp. KO-2023]|nr:hypothetical protein BSKO_08440 [Bryopsis sp. KO-2023]
MPRKRKIDNGNEEEEAAPLPNSPNVCVNGEDSRGGRRRAKDLPGSPGVGVDDSLRGRWSAQRRNSGGDRLDCIGAGDLEGGADDGKLDSIVKVFCSHTEPNFSLPWQRKRQYASMGSGFAVEGKRLLTNAHCIDHHTLVRVRKRGSDSGNKKYVARVVAVGVECDIAMLKVDEDEFWEGVKPVRFGDLPQLQSPVTVIGYPVGGDTMSVSSGVVSRIEVTPYVHGAVNLLGIQIDAAINAGNSGGPAFNDDGDCVGIAFQSLKSEDIENVGYIIPTPVIDHFIKDYDKNGQYTGFPCFGVHIQGMENPHLRENAKMKPNQTGVLVQSVEPTLPSCAAINEGDVLLKFDGVQIANDGTVPFRRGERINFTYLVSQKYNGDEVEVHLLKKGQEIAIKVQLKTPYRLIPVHIDNKPPSYFIVAGLVFTPVTTLYLRSEYGKDYDFDAPVKIVDQLLHGMAKVTGEQVVVLSQVLASDINIGYEEIRNSRVIKLNGQKIDKLKTLVDLVDSSKAEYLEFELDLKRKVVLKTKEAKAATSSLLLQHCIPSDRSSDQVSTQNNDAHNPAEKKMKV